MKHPSAKTKEHRKYRNCWEKALVPFHCIYMYLQFSNCIRLNHMQKKWRGENTMKSLFFEHQFFEMLFSSKLFLSPSCEALKRSKICCSNYRLVEAFWEVSWTLNRDSNHSAVLRSNFEVWDVQYIRINAQSFLSELSILDFFEWNVFQITSNEIHA